MAQIFRQAVRHLDPAETLSYRLQKTFYDFGTTGECAKRSRLDDGAAKG